MTDYAEPAQVAAQELHCYVSLGPLEALALAVPGVLTVLRLALPSAVAEGPTRAAPRTAHAIPARSADRNAQRR